LQKKNVGLIISTLHYDITRAIKYRVKTPYAAGNSRNSLDGKLNGDLVPWVGLPECGY
jgi:hypothetical protein